MVVTSLIFSQPDLGPWSVSQSPGLANRTAEKVKPSALDLLLLFKETVRLKLAVPGAKRTALRDVLFASIADYNKSVGNHRVPCLKCYVVTLTPPTSTPSFCYFFPLNPPTVQVLSFNSSFLIKCWKSSFTPLCQGMACG